jgi:hypothetical protein
MDRSKRSTLVDWGFMLLASSVTQLVVLPGWSYRKSRTNDYYKKWHNNMNEDKLGGASCTLGRKMHTKFW